MFLGSRKTRYSFWQPGISNLKAATFAGNRRAPANDEHRPEMLLRNSADSADRRIRSDCGCGQVSCRLSWTSISPNVARAGSPAPIWTSANYLLLRE